MKKETNAVRDIYKHNKYLVTLLDKISNSKKISKLNIEILLKWMEWSKLYAKNKKKQNGLSSARQYKVLGQFYRICIWLGKDLNKVDRTDIETLVTTIKDSDEYGEQTKRDYHVAIRQLFKWLYCSEYIPEKERVGDLPELSSNYPRLVSWIGTGIDTTKIRKKRILSVAEIEKMMNGARTIRDAALIGFVYFTGCRVGEALNTTIDDLTFTNDGLDIHIRVSKTKPRHVPVVEPMQKIAEYLNSRKDKENGDAYLWINSKGRGMSPFNVRQQLKRTAKKVGLDAFNIHPHVLRHSRASQLAAEGWTVFELMEFFGWDNIETAQQYVQTAGKQIKRKVDQSAGKEVEPIKVKRILCPRCKELCKSIDKFCEKCGSPLDARDLVKLTDSKEKDLTNIKEDMTKIVEFMLKNMDKDKGDWESLHQLVVRNTPSRMILETSKEDKELHKRGELSDHELLQRGKVTIKNR